MSSARHIQVPEDASRLPMTLPRLFEKKRLGEPIVMVTAYDYPSARAAEAAGVDLVLVGDSAGTTILGHTSTTPVELDELLVLALQEAGCFAIVFEAIPSSVAAEIMPRMEVPVIGIGAGPSTDGQVLVFHDLLGIREGLGARFVKRYANLQDEMDAGVAAFAADVRARRYPQPEHGYSIPDAELAAFRDE